MKQAICQENFFHNQLSYPAPAIFTFASDIGTPVDIFAKLSTDEQHAFLFESVEGDGRLARYSFLGLDPLLTVTLSDTCALINYRDSNHIIKQEIKNPVELLQEILSQYQAKLAQLAADASPTESQIREDFDSKCR